MTDEPSTTAPDPAEPDPVEPEAAGGRLGRRVLVGAAAVLALALVVIAALSVSSLRAADRREEARTAALAAARQQALNLIAVDGTDTDADIARVLDGSAGAFKADFQGRAADLKRVITGAKVVSSNLVVSEAAIVRSDLDSAEVIVSADSVVKNAAKPDGSPRTYRMRLELERAGDRWLTTVLEVVG